ncbi:MAG TPA: hypothetical protein VEK07_15705 [Polyangiaceae bacterium]|nr:hypothetical protein [Polyangiaceae bacterium]
MVVAADGAAGRPDVEAALDRESPLGIVAAATLASRSPATTRAFLGEEHPT